MTDEQLIALTRSRCLTCGDLKSRHQGKSTIGMFNAADPSCSVVGCSCPRFLQGSTADDGRAVVAAMKAWRHDP